MPIHGPLAPPPRTQNTAFSMLLALLLPVGMPSVVMASDAPTRRRLRRRSDSLWKNDRFNSDGLVIPHDWWEVTASTIDTDNRMIRATSGHGLIRDCFMVALQKICERGERWEIFLLYWILTFHVYGEYCAHIWNNSVRRAGIRNTIELNSGYPDVDSTNPWFGVLTGTVRHRQVL